MMTKAETTLKQALVALLQTHPFWGQLALRLTPIETRLIPTEATDGTHLWYNPDFMEGLSLKQAMFEVAHEVAHCVLRHCGPESRCGWREREKWKLACEHPTNFLCRDSGLIVPADAVMLPQYEAMCAEEVYAKMPDPPKAPKGGCAGFGNQSGLPRDPTATTLTALDWQIAVQQAAEAAKARGSLPAGLEQFVKALGKSEVDWRSYIRRFIQTCQSADDYSWKLPATRYIPFGLYLPRLLGERVGTLAVAIDSSGSTTSYLPAFIREMAAIHEEVQPEQLVLLYADAAVQKVETYGPDDVLDCRVKGFGGTDFQPVFKHLEADPPLCLIYVTDLDGAFPPAAPPYPVLWVVPKGTTIKAPFGDVVEVHTHVNA